MFKVPLKEYQIVRLVLSMVILTIIFAFVNVKTNSSEFVTPSLLIKGITVVAPPKPVGEAAFKKIKTMNANWVAFVPYGFSKKNTTSVHYNLDWQWWGEKIIGIESCIKEAKLQGLKVMLKPQIYVSGGWVGDMDFKKNEDWLLWEKNYKDFILDFVDLATRNNVDLFCIGTELNKSVFKRESFWVDLIKEIRNRYKGKLTYSANWDNYEQVKFWGDLDYAGISSYFPLTEAINPTLPLLNKEWKPIVKKLNSFSSSIKKQIIFTEYGYMSVDGCAGKSWEIEKNLAKLNINHLAQYNAYDALWYNLSNEKFWAGGFLWKWFPDGLGHEGYPEKDYTPQGKPAEDVLKKWFGSNQKI